MQPEQHGGFEEGRSNEGYMGDDGYDPEEDGADEIIEQDHEENEDAVSIIHS